MRLFQGFKRQRDFTSFDWIKDADGIIKYFQEAYSTKLSMQATGINPLLVIARKRFPMTNNSMMLIINDIRIFGGSWKMRNLLPSS
jgi:hypothetical protein